MERVLLKDNANDRFTGRDYPPGEYEVVEASEHVGQMDASFASRAIEASIAEDLSADALKDKNKDEVARIAEAVGADVSGDEKKDVLVKKVAKERGR